MHITSGYVVPRGQGNMVLCDFNGTRFLRLFQHAQPSREPRKREIGFEHGRKFVAFQQAQLVERSSKDTIITLNRDDGPPSDRNCCPCFSNPLGFPIEAAWAAKLAAVSRKAALCCFSSSINAVRSALASRRSRRSSCFRCRRAFPNIADAPEAHEADDQGLIGF